MTNQIDQPYDETKEHEGGQSTDTVAVAEGYKEKPKKAAPKKEGGKK